MPNSESEISVFVSDRRGEINVFHAASDQLLFSIHQAENPGEYLRLTNLDNEDQLVKAIEEDYAEEIRNLCPDEDTLIMPEPGIDEILNQRE